MGTVKVKQAPEEHTIYILMDEGENAVRQVSVRNAMGAEVNVDEALAPTIIDMVDGSGISYDDIMVYEVRRRYKIKAKFELENTE